MSGPGGLLPTIEAIAARATECWRAGEQDALARVIVEAVAPETVLEIGASGAASAGAILATSPRALRTWVGVGSSAAPVRAARVRLAADAPAGLDVVLHHASLFADGAPHVTRVPELVQALCRGYDLVVLEPPPTADRLYLALAQALPLLVPDGVLHCGPLDGCPGARDVVQRIAREGAGPAALWQPGEGGPTTLIARARRRRYAHEDTIALRPEILAGDPLIAAAEASGDHAVVCARLRHWLAARLAWSTSDLLLPLGALPPPLSVRDVVEECARGEGGVWSYGAAVTLAMLYRAFGYPATVYPYGVPELYQHMMTLVQLPDGRILVQDAFFDAELRLAGRPATWQEALALVRAGHAEALALPSEAAGPRPHLYSRASLERAAADGYLTPAERATLAVAMAGCGRVRGEPRAALEQDHTTSLAAYARLARNALALEALQTVAGVGTPLALLAFPCGVLPLAGERAFDAAVIAAFGHGTPAETASGAAP